MQGRIVAILADMASLDPVLPMGSLPQDDRSYVAVYVVASVVPVTALVVGVRIYTRWAVVKSFGIDDLAILAAMVSSRVSVRSSKSAFELTWFGTHQLLVIAEAVFQCLMAQTGLGKHSWMLTEKMTLRFYRVQYFLPVRFSSCLWMNAWLTRLEPNSGGMLQSSYFTPASALSRLPCCYNIVVYLRQKYRELLIGPSESSLSGHSSSSSCVSSHAGQSPGFGTRGFRRNAFRGTNTLFRVLAIF